MALDVDGYIKTPLSDRLQLEFQQVVDDVINRLASRLGCLLHSAYVYGSVAQGKAVAGLSDLDICVILTHQAGNSECRLLSEIRKEIKSNHCVVSKVDFDVGSLSEVLAPKNLYSWGYWLKHHCRCIWGEDLSKRFSRFRPSKAIALAVNGDFVSVLNDYMQRLTENDNVDEHKPIQKAAARKLIRSTNLLRSDDDTDWPDTLEACVVRFAKKYPMKESEIRYFLFESHNQMDKKENFIARLRTFMNWLVEANRYFHPNSSF